MEVLADRRNEEQQDARLRAMFRGSRLREIQQEHEETCRRHEEEMRRHDENMAGMRARNRQPRGRINRLRVVERTVRESKEELVVEATEEDRNFRE